jgi:glucokinase-like ROK family protein
MTRRPTQPIDQLESLSAVLNAVRSDTANTRPSLERLTGFGRTVISQRVEQLIRSGLIEDGAKIPSSGGRAPRKLVFRSDAGHLLVISLGVKLLSVGVSDLNGQLVDSYEEPSDFGQSIESIVTRVEELLDELVQRRGPNHPKIWAIGMGVPGPVRYLSGSDVVSPFAEGWERFPIRQHLSERYNVPVWVDKDVNLIALGELRAGVAQDAADAIYIMMGSGIGSALISAGKLHRGTQGAAGEIGHVKVSDDESAVCPCGNIGCLDSMAGGMALVRDGTDAAKSGRSKMLAMRLAEAGEIDTSGVLAAAAAGDPTSIDLVGRSGNLLGRVLAILVNFYNPSHVIIGGPLAGAGDPMLAAIREAIYKWARPIVTRDLNVVLSSATRRIGLLGAAFTVIDELFSREVLGLWIDASTPVELLHSANQLGVT